MIKFNSNISLKYIYPTSLKRMNESQTVNKNNHDYKKQQIKTEAIIKKLDNHSKTSKQMNLC